MINFDGPAKSMFSRKDAENAKEISFNINKLTLRALREILTFYEFTNFPTILTVQRHSSLPSGPALYLNRVWSNLLQKLPHTPFEKLSL